MKCLHSVRNESNREEILLLGLCTTNQIGQCIIVPITVIQDTHRILFTIFLTIFSNNFKATRTSISHVYSDWHPRKENIVRKCIQILQFYIANKL